VPWDEALPALRFGMCAHPQFSEQNATRALESDRARATAWSGAVSGAGRIRGQSRDVGQRTTRHACWGCCLFAGTKRCAARPPSVAALPP
jgi:hypothetical protein